MLATKALGNSAAPPLVLLHSGGMTAGEWDPFLDAWASRFRLIIPTALSHGTSPSVPELTVENLVTSTLEALDALQVARAHFLGSSMGGTTALHLALREPVRVDRLILYRTPLRPHARSQAAALRMADPENWRAWGLEPWMRREHAAQGGPEAWLEVIRKVGAAFGGSNPDWGVDRAASARIRQPTLIITGDRDDLVSLEETVEFYSALPDAALWVVPRAGHIMGMETWRREEFEGEVGRFLEIV